MSRETQTESSGSSDEDYFPLSGNSENYRFPVLQFRDRSPISKNKPSPGSETVINQELCGPAFPVPGPSLPSVPVGSETIIKQELCGPASPVSVPSLPSVPVTSPTSVVSVPRIVSPVLILEITVMPSYTNWSSNHDIISAQSFVPLVELVRTMVLIQRIPFSVKARRDESRETVGNLISGGVGVFANDRRFPDQARVNVTTGVVADLIDKIMSALDYGERYNAEASTSGGSNSKFSSLDDAKQSYYKGVQRLLDLLIKTKDDSRSLLEIYTQDTFEQTYSLTWSQ